MISDGVNLAAIRPSSVPAISSTVTAASEKYKNVHVMNGDAFKLDYNQYTILYLNRPFLPKTFAEFISLIESQLTHPILFIYYVDQQSGHQLYNRAGWTMKKRSIIRRIYGIPVPAGPQGYSIWEYTP